MAGIDINRTSAGVNLKPEQSNEIWQESLKQSTLMQLAKRVTLPGNGVEFDTLGESAPAQWVDETAEKPVINPTMGSRVMKPRKMARIIAVSTEFARDKSTLWNAIKAQASESIAKTVDMTFLTGAIKAPSTDGMDVLYDADSVSLGKAAYADFVKVYTAVSTNGGNLDGWAMSPQGQAKIIGATDANGRPLITPDAHTMTIGNVLGAPVYKSPWGHKAAEGEGKELLGIAGDWSQALFGQVGGMQIKASDQTTLNIDGTQISLWQHNMIAFMVEFECGFIVKNKSRFVNITA
jgi:HK97 family phage major capsid protein